MRTLVVTLALAVLAAAPGSGGAANGAQDTVAAPAPASSSAGTGCATAIDLPQDGGALMPDAVAEAIDEKFTKAGQPAFRVVAKRTADGLIAVQIFDVADRLQRRLEVDPATARIVSDDYFPRARGFAGPSSADTVSYEARLRRHMMGDGQAWAAWVGGSEIEGCIDDYRYGGPRLQTQPQEAGVR